MRLWYLNAFLILLFCTHIQCTVWSGGFIPTVIFYKGWSLFTSVRLSEHASNNPDLLRQIYRSGELSTIMPTSMDAENGYVSIIRNDRFWVTEKAFRTKAANAGVHYQNHEKLPNCLYCKAPLSDFQFCLDTSFCFLFLWGFFLLQFLELLLSSWYIYKKRGTWSPSLRTTLPKLPSESTAGDLHKMSTDFRW